MMANEEAGAQELERTRTALLVCTIERALLMDLATRVCKTEAQSVAHEAAVEDLESALHSLREDKPDLPRWGDLISGVAHVLNNHRFLNRIRDIGLSQRSR